MGGGGEREREITNYKNTFPASIFSLAPVPLVSHFILKSQAYMLQRILGMAKLDLAMKKNKRITD